AFAVRFGSADARTASADSKSGASTKAKVVASVAKILRPMGLRTAFTAAVGIAAYALIASNLHLWPFRIDALPVPPALSVGVLPLVASSGNGVSIQRAESLTRDISAQLAQGSVSIRIVPIAA